MSLLVILSAAKDPEPACDEILRFAQDDMAPVVSASR